jgi:hypothetical protein
MIAGPIYKPYLFMLDVRRDLNFAKLAITFEEYDILLIVEVKQKGSEL